VAGFLTDAWLDDLETAAKSAHVDPDVSLVLQQVVPDGPDGTEVAYAVVVRGGRVHVERGRAAHPDLTFTQDRATAEAIHRGDLSAQSAFMQGALRLGGDLCGLLGRATALAAVDDVFASVRA
jgi:hypothetical protein